MRKKLQSVWRILRASNYILVIDTESEVSFAIFGLSPKEIVQRLEALYQSVNAQIEYVALMSDLSRKEVADARKSVRRS